MAEDQEPSGPSLEPPSLFRRKKKKDAVPEQPQADDSPTTILDDVEAVTEAETVAEAEVEMTQPLAPPVPPTPDAPPPLFADEVSVPAAAPEPDAEPAPALVRRERTMPAVSGRVAAALAGLLAGAVIVGLTSASFELCSRIQGTNSCGGPGIFLLVAILVIAVVLGTVVLRLLKVPEPGSTSFLAVGLTSVIALLFLVDLLFEWWMVIVIPLVSVATFVFSHWVTTTFVEPAKPVSVVDEPEVVDHDVR
jgi:hypothetical protein